VKNLLALLFGGILIGAGLVVQDEILTLAMYCGLTCLYPYPFVGAFHLYDAEIIAFLMMLVGLGLFVASWTSMIVGSVAHLLEQQRNNDQSTDSNRSGNKGV
jgi:hypothetical protein